jgi:FAD-dependent oxidoreductase domain-containing protein 1
MLNIMTTEPTHDQTASYDVVIIGGGAVGMATAYYLRSLDPGCRVAVVERDSTYRLASTPRASGGVRRLFALPENIHLSNFSIPVFERFAELMSVNGDKPDIGFKKNGYLFIVPSEDVANLQRNYELQLSLGVNVQYLEPQQLKERFPSIIVSDLGGAVHSLDDGWLDPYTTLMTLRRKAGALGANLIKGEVTAIEGAGGIVLSVTLADGQVLKTGMIVNAAGAWAQQVCDMIGMKSPITPMRRFEHYFECEEPIEPLPYLKDVNRLAFRPEGKGYSGGVPAINEPRGFNFETEHDYFEEVVWPALAHRFPQFERTKCKNTLPGLYDQNDLDATPIIGPWSGHCENFYMAAGFSGHGLMHAPGCGLALSELILRGRYETIDLTRLGWDRIERGEPYREQGII